MSSQVEKVIDVLQHHANNWIGGADQELVDLYFMDLQLRSEIPGLKDQYDVHKELIADYTKAVTNPPGAKTDELKAERDSLLEKVEQLKVTHPIDPGVLAKHVAAFLKYLGSTGDERASHLASLKARVAGNKVEQENAQNWLGNIEVIKNVVQEAKDATAENSDLQQDIAILKRDLSGGGIASPSADE